MAAPLLSNSADPMASAATIGCVSEDSKEPRCALSPDAVKQLVKDGYKVVVQRGCGMKSFFTDAAYEQAGAIVASRSEVIQACQVVFTVNPPTADFRHFQGKTLVGWVSRLLPDGKDMVKQANAAGVTLVDVTAVPRITIAQKLDVLSSQAKVGGIRAVIEAAHAFKRFQSAEITAAGKYPPSQTFVLGCGVAGLAAMGQAKAMGSVVRAWDVRDVSDQAASLGAGWVKVDFKESGEGTGGYAKESSAEFQAAQRATFHKVCKEVDIVITTAAIPGRPSPRLIEDYMVKDMKPGSVIVDLAALGGGNCTLTRKDEVYTTENGVTIIGYTGLAGMMPGQASAMFAQNMVNLVRHIAKKDPTALLPTIDKELSSGESGDIIVRSIVCCKNNQELIMPKPPAPTNTNKPKEEAKKKEEAPVDPFKAELKSAFVFTAVLGLLAFMGLGVQVSLLGTFVLAGAAGYQVVWGVVPALHTPLMSVTNAISGLTAVGGLLLFDKANNFGAIFLAVMGGAISCVNIFGGFVVSKRMLLLFKRKEDVDLSYLWLLPAITFIAVAFLVAADRKAIETLCGLMCIIAIGGLASMKTANAGCTIGISAVATAMVATLLGMQKERAVYAIICCVVPGLVGGGYIGKSVDPIKLPQTVAAFHSLVGLAAMVTSIGNFTEVQQPGFSMENIFALLGDLIGGITLTGSIIAYLKLDARMSSTAWNLPGKNLINLASLFAFFGLSYLFLTSDSVMFCMLILWAIAALACWMGVHLVASVGGGDMPVCITVLNSYSGWALVSEGFMLKSSLLTIVGSLIGFSGAILTHIMCVAMNRQITNVIFGGMNNTAPIKTAGDEEAPPEHREINPEMVAELLADAKEVMIIPGYGMAVARAQSQVASIASTCKDHGVNVRFGIHPVAGRMPGQMNVLLAEAGVPYDWVFELDEVNDDMENVDVCLVVGANDITNIAAQESEGCPIYGMPVFSVWTCKNTVFFKRSMRAGYADLPNPCFYKENATMCLGNADKTCDTIASKLKEAFDNR
jgi:NAD(P) transhydrogenase